MYKKLVIVGLVLFLAGTAAFGWVLAEQRKARQLLQKRQENLKASLDKLDKVVAGETDVYPSVDVASDEDLQQALDKHKMRKETIELVHTGSIMCMVTGGAISTWWLLLCTARLLITGLSNLKQFSSNYLRRRRKAREERVARAQEEEDEEALEQGPHEPQSQSLAGFDENSPDGVEALSEVDEQSSQLEKRAMGESGLQNLETDFANRDRQAHPQMALPMRSEPRSENVAKDSAKIAVLLSDEESVEFEEPLKVGTEAPSLNAKVFDQLAQSLCRSTLLDSREDSLKLEDSLKAQTENLEKQVEEFKQMTQAVQQTALEHSEPLNNTLKELTQQVAAIREYASQQQDRVTKFQDGYDWNIIRSFCLRVIRCIDNLENRINRLHKQNVETADLEEVRDELIFALESSGVEQFEPEINSDYRGQERDVEAVKDKEHSDDPNLRGKIAKVIKPGYRYVISEENVRVVRPAQVKLYN